MKNAIVLLVALTAFSGAANAGLGRMALAGGVAYASQHKAEMKDKARAVQTKSILALNAATLRLKYELAKHHK